MKWLLRHLACFFFNHEPESRASRNARLARPLPTARLKSEASPRVASVRDNPRPGGCARGSVTKTRVPRDTKAFKPHVEARKAFGAFSNELRLDRGMSLALLRHTPCLSQSVPIRVNPWLTSISKIAEDRGGRCNDIPAELLSGRELCEAFSCDRRSADKFSCRPKDAFVTDATTQPRGTGLTRTAMTTNDAEGIRFGGIGELGNRATRDVVAFGSWLKTAGAVRYRPCG